jgi:hypothetical protein
VEPSPVIDWSQIPVGIPVDLFWDGLVLTGSFMPWE